LRRLIDDHGGRMAKFVTGSAIATVVATGTFVAVFGSGLLGSKASSLVSSAVAAVVAYFLNRHWTWGRRDRADLRSEMLPYWGMVIGTAIVAALVTGAANNLVRTITPDRGIRTVTNAIAYLGTYGVFFLLKYRVFHALFHQEEEEQRSAGVAAERTQ
jgi:putative flippase GtrA